jgi:hypothetical protein
VLKIANVVSTVFLKQKEIVSLCWMNKYEVSVSGSSNEDNVILQKDSKAASSETATMEALTDDAAQHELIHAGPRTSKRQRNPQQ